MNNWKKANEELLNATDFGRPLREDTDWLQEYVDKATATAYSIGAMDNTKAIYYYVSSPFPCTNHYDKNIKTNLRHGLTKNTSTVADINLILITLLKMKGTSADPLG